jgi:predicted HicB family RNase H-like nuclease
MRTLKPKDSYIALRTSAKLKAKLLKEAGKKEISLSHHIEQILKRKRK